jgi:hypothetical protein
MRSFLWINKMATDVEVQFFSHLNGLTLGNNQGDLIRLLDKALVTGINFTEITSASINEQGDVTINLYAAHNAMLFQIVELSGFSPASLNQKYRIKGVPSATQLILKPQNEIGTTVISTVGAGKLASLGYEIIFRDANDVKRVYRAKNPTAQHPFIRVDESLASATGSYTATYAKYAMVGLLEHMEHIDDYENPDVLQLPFNPSDPAKNWKITGTGMEVVRGWSRWYFATAQPFPSGPFEYISPSSGSRHFTLCGDSSAFYFVPSLGISDHKYKVLYGVGLFESALDSDVVPNWFLFTQLRSDNAGQTTGFTNYAGGSPLSFSNQQAGFFATRYSITNPISSHIFANPIIPDLKTGSSNIYSANNISALEIPFYDDAKHLRGSLKHIYYSGNNKSARVITTPLLEVSEMYVQESIWHQGGDTGGIYFYLGCIE